MPTELTAGHKNFLLHHLLGHAVTMGIRGGLVETSTWTVAFFARLKIRGEPSHKAEGSLSLS